MAGWGAKKMKLLRKRKMQARAKKAPKVNMYLMSKYYTRITRATAALPVPRTRGVAEAHLKVQIRRHQVINGGQPWHGAFFQGFNEHNRIVLIRRRSFTVSMLADSHGTECMLVREERLLTVIRFSLSKQFGTHERAKWALANGAVEWYESRDVPIEEYVDGDASLPILRQDKSDPTV